MAVKKHIRGDDVHTWLTLEITTRSQTNRMFDRLLAEVKAPQWKDRRNHLLKINDDLSKGRLNIEAAMKERHITGKEVTLEDIHRYQEAARTHYLFSIDKSRYGISLAKQLKREMIVSFKTLAVFLKEIDASAAQLAQNTAREIEATMLSELLR